MEPFEIFDLYLISKSLFVILVKEISLEMNFVTLIPMKYLKQCPLTLFL